MRDENIHDTLLDEALNTYAVPGPNSGMETRVLARLSAFRQQPHRRSLPRWQWFALASPAAAYALYALLAFSGLMHRGAQSRPAPSTVAGFTPDKPPIRARSDQQAPTHRSQVVCSARSAKRELESPATASTSAPSVFPAIPSLTPEEHAFLDWQQHASDSARQSLVQPQSQPDPPQHIAAIHIAPLETPDLGSE